MEPQEIVNIKENLTLIDFEQIDFSQKRGKQINRVN